MRLSEFRHREVNVPAPKAAFTLATIGSGTIDPVPLGEYEITYTLVDKDNRHSQMAPPVTVCLNKHWHMVVRTVGIAPFNPAIGYCVWWRRTDEIEWRVMGCQQFCVAPSQVYTPYLPFTGWTEHRYRGHMIWLSDNAWPNWNNTFWLKGSSLAKPVEPLQIKVLHPPKHGFEAAWSWATDHGETGLSPYCDVPSAAQGERYEVRLACNETPRNGAHGRYLYIREQHGQPWHRQKAPNGSWMWPLHANTFTINHFEKTNAYPIGGGKSTLHPIQWMLEDGSIQHIEVDSDVSLTSPLVNPYRESDFYRTISAPQDRQWRLNANHYGPIYLEGNQRTRLIGCWMASPTATAGIDFIDNTGGGAFHFRAERCRIDLYNRGSGAFQESYGIGVTKDSANASGNNGNHSCSEPVFSDCEVTAYHPVVIEGDQSANWTFDNVNIYSPYLHDTAAFVLNSSNHLAALKKVTVDGTRALVAAVSAKQVKLENVWVDQGIQQWFVVSNKAEPAIECTFTRANNNHQFQTEQHVVVQTALKRADIPPMGTAKGEVNNLPKVVFPGAEVVEAIDDYYTATPEPV